MDGQLIFTATVQCLLLIIGVVTVLQSCRTTPRVTEEERLLYTVLGIAALALAVALGKWG